MMARIDNTIRTNQVYAAGLMWFMIVPALVTLFVTLVPGACLGGGLAGVTFSALPHIVWLIPTLAVLYFTVDALGLDTNADYTNTASKLMIGAVFMIVAGVAVNGVHLVALILEVNNLDSTFWAQSSGAWVYVLLAETVYFTVLSAWVAWRMYVFRHDLIIGYQMGWRPGMAISEEDLNAAPTAPERDDVEDDALLTTALPPLPSVPSDQAGAKIAMRSFPPVSASVFHAVGWRVADAKSE